MAAGNGNATLAAARRGCLVTSTDYVAMLLERGQDRARAEHLEVTFQVADAEALPFADGSFAAVLSTFGVMFAPDQDKAAAELARVCRRGGRIGLANWTPPEGCTEVAIFGDNDPKFAGQAAAYQLASRLASTGIDVTVHIPRQSGWDWNDELMTSYRRTQA